MTGILIQNLADRNYASALLEVLQLHIDKNIVIVRLEEIRDPGNFTRTVRFLYSKIDEALKFRHERHKIPQYPIDIKVPEWNTHLDIDLVLAKFALVR